MRRLRGRRWGEAAAAAAATAAPAGDGDTLTLRDSVLLAERSPTPVVKNQTDDDGARRQLRAAAEAAELPMPAQPPIPRCRVHFADQAPTNGGDKAKN